MERDRIRQHRGEIDIINHRAYRLTQHLCTFGMDKQCGSLFGKGCVDATFTLKKALQQLHKQGQDTHVLLVDLVKAYDSVNRELLWKILNKYGVPKEMITVLKKLHTKVKYLLRVGKEKVEISYSRSDTRQQPRTNPIHIPHTSSSYHTRQRNAQSKHQTNRL
jgi:hypothetical protein